MSKKLKEHTLLNNAIATTDGVWYDTTAWKRGTLHVEGISGDTIIFCGSCSDTKPADGEHDITMETITADGLFQWDAKIKWIKARVTVYSAGGIYAWAVGDETSYGL